MDFVRECGSIQADLARRAGLLLKQYSTLTSELPESQKYDVTLGVAVLGLLLVNCNEAMANMEADQRTHLLWPDIRRLVVKPAESNFPAPLAQEIEANMLGHLRNAISHPLPVRQVSPPSTGHTTRPVVTDPRQKIAKLEFVSSPWVNEKGPLPAYQSRSRGKVESALGRFKNKYNCEGVLQVRESSNGVFYVVDCETGDPYFPVFKLTLTVKQVADLALTLANFLAHAERPSSWNGEALEDLLTA